MHKRHLARITLAVLIVLGPIFTALAYAHFFVLAQEDIRIHYGETKQGSIEEAGGQESWPFEGKAGDVIRVHVSRTSGDLIPAVSLTDPKDTLLVEFDWLADGPSVSQFVVTLRSSGIHTLTIGGSAQTTGDYSVRLELLTAGISEIVDNTIDYGQTSTGKISDEVFRQYWSFRGNQSDVVDVTMVTRSGDLDGFLSLINPDGNVIATTSTGGEGLDAALYSVKLPSSGTYTIVARRAGSDFGETASTQGTYDLTLALRVPGSTDNQPVPATLTLGIPIRGKLTSDAPASLYTIDASGILSLSLETSDPLRIGTVSVMTPDRALLGVFSGISPLRGSVSLPGQGTVLVEVAAQNIRADLPIDFELNVDQLKTAKGVSHPLRYGYPQTAPPVSTSSADAWNFGAEAGDLVTVSLIPNTLVLEGQLEVRAPDGTSVFSQAIRNGIHQSLVLGSTGTYELFIDPGAVNVGYRVAVDLDGSTGVAFAQYAVPDEHGILVPSAATAVHGDLASTRSDAWTFNVDGAGLWDFSLTNSMPDSPIALLIEAPDGHTLAMGLSSELSGRLSLSVPLPEGGRYRAVVFDLAGVGSQSYTLSAKTVSGGVLPTRTAAKGVLSAGVNANRWTMDIPSDSILSVRIDTVSGSAEPDVSVIGPDGLLRASTVGGENDLAGVPFSVGGPVQIIVSGTGNEAYLAYHIEADIDQPFSSGTVWRGEDIPGPEVYATDVPTTSAQRVLLSQVIAPSVSVPADILSSAPFAERETLVRGQIEQNSLYGIWAFQVLADQTQVLTVTSIDEVVEPVVRILNQDGIVLAQNRKTGTTSSTVTHRFSAGGTYYAAVQLPPDSRYTLWMNSLSGIDETLPSVVDGYSIQYGDTVSGELAHSDQIVRYAFYGHEDDLVYIQLNRTQGEAPAHLTLQNVDGKVLSEIDLVPDAWETTISDVQLAESQIYQIAVSSVDAEESSTIQFSLHLNLRSRSLYSDHDGGTIRDEVVSSLSVEHMNHHWLFDAQAEEQITVTVQPLMGGSPTPLRLELADTGGHVFLAKDADLGHGTLRFSDVLLPRSGVYQIIISGGQQTPGLYRLLIEKNEDRMAGDAGALRYAETVGEVLTPENYLDVWIFAGSQGDVVNISARAVRGDSALLSFQIRSGDGQVLATVVDDGSGAGAHVEDVVLPANEHYSIVVGNLDGSFQGQTVYELTAYLVDTKARSMGTLIEYGQQVEGAFFTDDLADTWLFDGQQGDVVTISASGENPLLMPTLTLASTDWHAASTTLQIETLTTAQVIEGNLALIDRFVLPATGTYAVDIQDSTQAGGTYQITLTVETADAPVSGALSSNRAQTGQISSGDLLDVWTFDGVRNSLLDITVASDSRSELAPAFSIAAPDGTILAHVEAEPNGVAHVQDLRLPLNGTYTIHVTRALGNAGHTDGRYSIEIQETAPNRVVKSAQYDRLERGVLDETTSVEYWDFVGQAGDVVRVHVEATSGDLDSLVRIYTPEGILLASADDVYGLDAEVTAQLAADGAYTVEVSRYGGLSGITSGNYSLLVTRVYQQGSVNVTPMIGYGERVTGIADQATPDHEWFFMGEAGDVISAKIQFPLDDAPLALTLRDPIGSILATGTRDRGDVVLDPSVLPAGGVYSLKVHRPADARASDYSPYVLDLQLLDFVTTQPAAQGGTLSFNQAVLGLFVEAPAVHSWIFVGNAGQNINVLLIPLERFSALRFSLISPDSSVLIETSTASGNLSTGSIQLPLTGTYTLLVSGDEAVLGMTYRLRLQPVNASTAEGEVLAIPDDRFGSINDLQPSQNWVFEGHEGTTIALRVSLTSGDFIPTLMLWGPLNEPLAEGVLETTSNGPQLSLSGFTLPQDGRYQLSIGRSGGSSGSGSGGYHLLLRANDITPEAASAVNVSFDRPVSGILYGVNPAYYAFQGEAGDVVAVSVLGQNGAQVPDLHLETENGDPIRISLLADSEETSIPFFPLPKTERYVITLLGTETTPFVLTVTRRNAVLSPDSRTRNLGLGQAFLDAIDNPAVPTYWLFSGTAGDVLSFTVDTSASGLRADVALYGSHGYIIGATESASSHQNISLGPIRLPDTGDYFLLVQSWLGRNGETTGRYSVLANSAEPGVSGSAGGYIPIKGMTVTGGLIPEDPEDIWTFDGQAGEVVTINAQSTSGDNPFAIHLRSPDGVELAQSASDSILASIEHFTLPETGLYSAVVQGGTATEYRLSIVENRSALTSSLDTAQNINYGQNLSVSVTPGVYNAWVFFGRAGEHIQANAVLEAGSVSPQLFLVNPSGHVSFAAHSETATNAVIPSLVLVETGFYALVVRVDAAASDVIPLILSLAQVSAGTKLQGILDEPVTGELSFSSPVHEWTVLPTFSGHYLVRLDALTVGTVPDLFVRQEDGSLMAGGTVDDNGRYREAVVLLEAGRTYTTVVSSGPVVTRQNYKLALIPASLNTGGGSLVGGDIGRINDLHLTDEWAFDVETVGSGNLEVMRTSGDLVATVSVYNPDGILIKEGQAAEDGSLSLPIECLTPGRYTVLVSRADLAGGLSEGDYTIQISS